MSTIRRVVARARRRLVLVGCLVGLTLITQHTLVFAENETRQQIPDPATWNAEEAASDSLDADPSNLATTIRSGSATDEAARNASADSTDTRRPVAKMVWRTVTSPSGRTFQVLEPASPEEIEQAARDAREAAGRAADGDSVRAAAAGASEDIAMMGDLGTRRSGRGTGGDPSALGQWMNQGGVPRITSFGVYGGYASTAGLQLAIPTDATFAFRMGLTGFPGIGWLFTPGVELRFGQEPGTFSTDGVYGFSNLYVGETVSADPVKKHWGVETGGGYRWILPDRRSVRWIAAIEIGGRWSPSSSAPKTPTVRAFWMIAAP